ncbi:MAG TPA: undecaprenyldiphospho-muramoylpentapeptide beta-N-acetylglucosaminyltransferase [Mycobacteriales bacterium]|nr:undecaprenyldiphospho-muramoylpentapeptide beta-N-acetylglucosaminyltransferase [Mycobacteriales bacterium]
MNVVIAGGGSAGHVEPALNIADALRRRGPDVTVSLVGTARGLETRLVPARGYALDLIPAVPLPRRPSADLLRVPGRLVGAVRAAGRILDRRRPDVVVGVGGYVALPVYFAARRRSVPVVIHEANARAGLANRVGARFAAAVATSYPQTVLPGSVLTGIPLRQAIVDLDRASAQELARAHFGLLPQRPTLLVSGGSQGARRLNEAAVGVAADLDALGVQVLHASGPGQYDVVTQALAVRGMAPDLPPYVVAPFVDRMDLAYAAADLMLCRAGAMTVAEVSAVGLPAAFVPLPHGNGEQRLNAAHVVAAGGAVEVDDSKLDTDWVRLHLLTLLTDPERLAAMGSASRACGHRDAAEQVAALVETTGRAR